MKSSTLTITQHDHAGAVELRIEGELDLAVTDRLEGAIRSAAAGADLLVLDLSACEFIDSSAISVFLRSKRELAKTGKRLVLCAPGRQVQRVLSVTGLMENGLVFARRDEALAGD